MPSKDGPLKLSLPKEMREQLDLELCRRISNAVADSSDRNDQLSVWRDQVEGLGQTATNQTWQGACDLTDPLTLEAFLSALSQLMQAMRASSPIAVEGFTKEDEEGARLIEDFCAVEASRQSLWKVFYDAAHNACIQTAVPIYVGWQWKERQKRTVRYRIPGQEGSFPEEEKTPGENYEEVPWIETEFESGYDIRVLNLVDFFTYPANAPSLDKATMAGHRWYATEDELIDGIEDFGFDKEKVFDLIDAGPNKPESEDFKDEQDSSDGVEPAEGNHSYYTLYTFFTRLPRRVGDELTPQHLRHDDFLCVCCPAQNIVLKLDFSPFPERPYYLGNILPRPADLQGYCIPSLLEGLQAEGNANIRFTIDSMNLTMSPALKVKKSEASSFNKYKIYPGVQVPVSDMNDFQPIEWDRAPLRDGLGYQQWIQNRSQGVISAEGAGQLQPKVRKSGEIAAVTQQAATKFGLYLLMFQLTVVAPLFERMVSLKAHFGDVDEEDGEEFVGGDSRPLKLTTKALRGRYQFLPAVTSLTMSPEVRAQTDQMLEQIVASYIQSVTTLPPQFHKGLWRLARRRLHDLGEHNPQTFIGDEPEPQPQEPQGPPEAPENVQTPPGGINNAQQQFGAENGNIQPSASGV